MAKEAKNWYIAATHYLTAGFVVPLLGWALVIIALWFLPEFSLFGFDLLFLVVTAVIIWIAIRYSANFINGRYVIKDKSKVVRLSTIYFAVVGMINLGWSIYSVISSPGKEFNSAVMTSIGWNVTTVIVATIVFYFGSKKYIESNSRVLEEKE